MKKYLLILFCLGTGAFIKANAQTPDMVSIGAGYTNQVYYSLQNGASPGVDNLNWDLGFQLRGFAASIMINAKNNMRVYRANKDVSQWASITAADTVGILNSTYELLNSDLSWDLGALSGTYDTANAFDLGWGYYDFTTHIVTGDSLYFLQMPNGDFKKLWIESLTAGIFYFRWADLDGQNEITASLDKSNFTSKFFGYYSIVNNQWLDREPVAHNQWDLLFTQYLAINPIIYKVTGVLSNDSVLVARAYPVDVPAAVPSNQTYSPDINMIGYNWKTYDFANNIWTIEDSLVYFIRDRGFGMWKVIFTGFGGAANGNYEFTKEFLGVVGVEGSDFNALLSVYPNPTTEKLNLVIAKQPSSEKVNVKILNLLGEVVQTSTLDLASEINTLTMDVNDLANGMYLLSIEQNGVSSSRTFVVQ
jgi:hypothetical protein